MNLPQEMVQILEFILSVEFMSPAVGVFMGVVVGVVIHLVQRRRARVLPYLPSYSDAVDTEHDSATLFFAAVHDMTMCVTEAWNTKHGRRADSGSVETQLHHEQLYRACEGVETHGNQLMVFLSEYDTLSESVGRGRDQLDGAWEYTSRDNYHTETYTVTTTDSEGNTQTETRTRQVYDDTDHWFTFKRSYADQAETTLNALGKKRAGITLKPPNVRRMKVKLEKMNQAERMFLERLYKQTIVEDAKAQPSDDELLAVANQWLVGTELDANLGAFEVHMDRGLSRVSEEFHKIYDSRASYHFNTTSRSHPGPPGYQATNRLKKPLSQSYTQWQRVVTMWTTCRSVAKTLVDWAQDSEEIESDKDYAREAIEAYEAAFPNSSIEVDQLTTPGQTLLIAILIAVAVAVIVIVAHPDGIVGWDF